MIVTLVKLVVYLSFNYLQEKEFNRIALEVAANRSSIFGTNLASYKTEIPTTLTNWSTNQNQPQALSYSNSASNTGFSYQMQSGSLSGFDFQIGGSTSFKASLSVKSSEREYSSLSKLQEAIERKKQIDLEKCKTVLQHRDLRLRHALETRMFDVASDIDQAILVLETCAKGISQPRDAHYFVNFLKIKIREPYLNDLLLKTKAQIAQYICDPNGVIKQPSLQDEKKITEIVENFKLQVQEWIDNQRFSLVDQAVDFRNEIALPQPDSNSFSALGSSYYEQQLGQNLVNKDLLEIDRLCQLGNFNEAAPLVQHYLNLKKQTVLTAQSSDPYALAHLLYQASYTQKFDSYGIEKRFSHDPAYKKIIPTLQPNEIPRPNPELNTYFQHRETTFNQITSTLHINTITPELRIVLYTVVDLEQNPLEVSHTLAQALSSDDVNKNIQEAYAKFYTEQSLPKLYKWHESLAHLKVPAHFSTQEYTPERALLTDLALLYSLNPEVIAFKNGITLLINSSTDTRQACRVMAQALVTTGLQSFKKLNLSKEIILNCKNLGLNAKHKETQDIQNHVHTIAAHMVSRACNPKCLAIEKEKLQYLLQKIDALYGKVIHQHSNQAQQELKLLFSSNYMQQLMKASPPSIEVPIKTTSLELNEPLPEPLVKNENLQFDVEPNIGLDTKLTTPEMLQTPEFDTKLFQEVLKDPELAQLIHEAFEKR